jgi:lysophospholipase
MSDDGYVTLKGLANRLKLFKMFFDQTAAETFKLKENELITPLTPYKKRIKFRVLEFDELIDSSNINHHHQIEIAKTIEKNYSKYDGFVVCHGTDTLAYTSSILSFMLENLQKTVVVTGSQIPIEELRNDAQDNLLGALLVAGHFVIPEVTVYFNDKLYRGNRVSKVSSNKLEAFNTPNIHPLGNFNVSFELHWDKILHVPG